MKKRLLGLLFVLAVLCAVLCVSASAASNGTCGDNLTWTLDDAGTLTISGSGEMVDYDWSDSPWYSDRSSIKQVVIADGVTSIGERAFYDCRSLTSVTISDSVTIVGEGSFCYCTSLPSVTIPDSVTSIGDWAFSDCRSLTSVTIPGSVTSIGDRAFDCCTSLTSVTISGSVTSIGKYAFDCCRSLTSVTICNGATSIGDWAFSECSSLTSVTIPGSVTSIGEGAFSQCYSLTSINVDPANAYYASVGGVLFNKDQTTLVCYPAGRSGGYTIPSSVTSIGESAFSCCTSLTSVTICNGVTSIGDWAFKGCSSLTSVTIPDSVTTIGKLAFAWCYSLPSVTIPDSVTSSIGKLAFYCCDSLTSITIGNSVTSIGDDAFEGCTSLTTITIPNSVTSIGNYAFAGCTSLTSVTIPDSVTIIGYKAFVVCNSLKDVYYSGSESDWAVISIDSGNECLTKATIHYNSTGGSGGTAQQEHSWSGNFAFSSAYSAAENENLIYDYQYDDNWFLVNNETNQYNLIRLSIRVAMAAYGDKNHGSSNITAFMDELRFTYSDQYVNYPEPEQNSIGYAIGYRNVLAEDNTETSIILVAVRGGGYGVEWGGNFYMGESGNHEGFSIASLKVLDGLKGFLTDNASDLCSNKKIWIVGYSRGAATANLVAAKLDNGYIRGITNNNVMAYCFECPQNTVDENASDRKYNNIINIVNPIDFVTKVAMTDWGFTRYGMTYTLPSRENTANYSALKSEMEEQYTRLFEENDWKVKTSELLAPGPTGERFGQASTLDKFMTALVEAVQDRANYHFNNHEVILMDVAASTLGKGGGTNWGKLGAELCELVGVFRHPIITTRALSMFTRGEAAYAHYAELCLSWIDSLGGMDVLYNLSSGTCEDIYRMLYVDCPVDIEVYDSTNALVARIVADTPEEIEDGIISFVDDDGQKVIVLPTDEEYSICLTATDAGTVSYTMTEYNASRAFTGMVVSYQEIPIQECDTLTGYAENLEEVDEADYALLLNDETLEPDVVQTGDDVASYTVTVSTDGNGTVYGGGVYVSGEFAKATVSADDSGRFLGWYVDGALVSEDSEYRFLVDQDVEITAVFQPHMTTNLVVTQAESGYTVSGEIVPLGHDTIILCAAYTVDGQMLTAGSCNVSASAVSQEFSLTLDGTGDYIKLFVLRASDWMPFDESITIAP